LIKFSGFLANSILGSHAKNYENRGSDLKEGWGKISFDHQYLPQFLSERAEIFCAFRHSGGPSLFWISRP